MSKDIIISTERTIEAPTGPITLLLYGDMRSGKTRFAATMPRPLFLAEHSEGGWTTIQTMDRSLWYEPNFPPIVKTIENVGDLVPLVQTARDLIKSGRVQTVVVDSITFYADLYLAFLTQGLLPEKQDPRQIYGKLGVHLREKRVEVHRLGVNVAWLALAADPDDDHPNIRPMIPGKEGAKFGAGCSFILYFRKIKASRDGGAAREYFDIFTRNEGKAIAGGRDGGTLPSPLPGNTYRDFMAAFDATRIVTPAAALVSPTGAPIASARPQGAGPRSFAPRK